MWWDFSFPILIDIQIEHLRSWTRLTFVNSNHEATVIGIEMSKYEDISASTNSSQPVVYLDPSPRYPVMLLWLTGVQWLAADYLYLHPEMISGCDTNTAHSAPAQLGSPALSHPSHVWLLIQNLYFVAYHQRFWGTLYFLFLTDLDNWTIAQWSNPFTKRVQ